MNTFIKAYLNQIQQNLTSGAATEHTHRPALAALFESAGVGIKAINEPKRIACGAPILAVLRDSLMVGHAEAKDVGEGLDRAERSDQLKRYRAALDNLILTDCLEFRWYVGGEQRRVVRVARWDGGKLQPERGGAEALAELLGDFLATPRSPSTTPKELAERMARLAHLIREIIVTAFEHRRGVGLAVGLARRLLPRCWWRISTSLTGWEILRTCSCRRWRMGCFLRV